MKENMLICVVLVTGIIAGSAGLLYHKRVEHTMLLTNGPVVTNMRSQQDEPFTRTNNACEGMAGPQRLDCESIPVVSACDLPVRDRVWFYTKPKEAGPLHALGVRCPGDPQDEWDHPYYERQAR